MLAFVDTWGQQTSIKGSLKDTSTNENLQYAVVSIIRQNDSI